MSVWDQIQQSLAPHADRLNTTIASGAFLLHNRLERIEEAVSDMGRPDVGDRWVRLAFKREFKENEKFELAEIPPNEIWLPQSLVTDGVQNKSPAYIICGDEETKLYFSVIKEGIGTETTGGDMVFLTGETIFIIPRATGTIGFTMHLIRRRIPVIPKIRQAAAGDPLLQGRNTHEVQRDLVASANGQWTESPRETELPPHEKVVKA